MEVFLLSAKYAILWKRERENIMSTYEDRITILERKIATLEQVAWQQAQTVKDRTNETAIVLGLLTDDVRILKENVTALRIRVNEGFTDLNRTIYSLEEKVDKRLSSVETELREHTTVLSEHTVRFDRLETTLNEHTTTLKEHTTLLTQILARLPEKP
jgi:chromosome segregation ATPase